MDGGRCFVDVAMRLNTLLKAVPPSLSLSLLIFIICLGLLVWETLKVCDSFTYSLDKILQIIIIVY